MSEKPNKVVTPSSTNGCMYPYEVCICGKCGELGSPPPTPENPAVAQEVLDALKEVVLYVYRAGHIEKYGRMQDVITKAEQQLGSPTKLEFEIVENKDPDLHRWFASGVANGVRLQTIADDDYDTLTEECNAIAESLGMVAEIKEAEDGK